MSKGCCSIACVPCLPLRWWNAPPPGASETSSCPSATSCAAAPIQTTIDNRIKRYFRKVGNVLCVMFCLTKCGQKKKRKSKAGRNALLADNQSSCKDKRLRNSHSITGIERNLRRGAHPPFTFERHLKVTRPENGSSCVRRSPPFVDYG